MFPARHPDTSVTRRHGQRAEPAPYRPAAASRRGTAERFGAKLLERYLRGVARRNVITYTSADGAIMNGDELNDVVGRMAASSMPIIVTYWIADALAVAMLPLLDGVFGDLLRVVTCVVDDTFTGRVAGRFVESIGGCANLVALPGDPERLRQVYALMRRRTSCAFPVDGGGPYGEVGTGIIALATAIRATIVPIAAIARPALPPLHASLVRLPLPGTKIVVTIGPQVTVSQCEDRRVEADHLRSTLDNIHRVAIERALPKSA